MSFDFYAATLRSPLTERLHNQYALSTGYYSQEHPASGHTQPVTNTMPVPGTAPFATFLIIGPTCFFLGILFALFPYDYYVLWSTPTSPAALASGVDLRDPYFTLQENHLRFLHASPPLISRILHIVIGTGLLGFMMKLYKPSDANMLFDGASLVLYMCGIAVYIANIVKGLRLVTAGIYGPVPGSEPLDPTVEYVGREDSLRVLAASNTILALVLMGVLVLQAGQWYAQRKEAEEIASMDRARDEKRVAAKKDNHAQGAHSHKEKKKQ